MIFLALSSLNSSPVAVIKILGGGYRSDFFTLANSQSFSCSISHLPPSLLFGPVMSRQANLHQVTVNSCNWVVVLLGCSFVFLGCSIVFIGFSLVFLGCSLVFLGHEQAGQGSPGDHELLHLVGCFPGLSSHPSTRMFLIGFDQF